MADLDRFDRALTTLAGMVADLRATEQRCPKDAPDHARLFRAEADAVRSALIEVLANEQRSGLAFVVAIQRADELIAEAVNRRG